MIYKTGQSLEYIFSDYRKFCTLTNNKCQQCNCIHFHNNIKSNILDCEHIDNRLVGISLRQLVILSIIFNYYENRLIYNVKKHAVDIINAIFSKNKYDMLQENNFLNTFLSIFEEDVGIVSKIDKIIENIMTEQNISKLEYLQKDFLKNLQTEYKNNDDINESLNIEYKYIHFIELIYNSTSLNNNDIKKQYIKFFTNIIRMLCKFPNHIDIKTNEDMLKKIHVKINNKKLTNEKITYIKGDQDEQRLEKLESDDSLLKFISYNDILYHIYTTYNITEKDFYLLLNIYDFINNAYENLENNNKDDINIDKLKLLTKHIDFIITIIEDNFLEYKTMDEFETEISIALNN